MARMILVLVALFVGIALCGVSIVRAQTPPGGPTVTAPHHTNPPQAQSHLPPEIRDAPYNGPSAPPLTTVAVPRNQQEAEALKTNPTVQQAARAGQTQAAAVDVARQMTQRVQRGDHALPSAAERQAIAGSGYNADKRAPGPPQPPPGVTPQPLRRSGNPLVDTVLGKLGLTDLATDAKVADAPDDEPSLQIPIGACAIYPFLWESTDYQYNEDIFYGESFHTCAYLAPGEELWYMATEQAVYACPWLLSWVPGGGLCVGTPYWVADMIPPCAEYYPPHSYQWCGPRVWYPPDVGKGYILRTFGQIYLTNGAFGYGSRDSAWLAYKCDRHAYYDSCS